MSVAPTPFPQDQSLEGRPQHSTFLGTGLTSEAMTTCLFLASLTWRCKHIPDRDTRHSYLGLQNKLISIIDGLHTSQALIKPGRASEGQEGRPRAWGKGSWLHSPLGRVLSPPPSKEEISSFSSLLPRPPLLLPSYSPFPLPPHSFLLLSVLHPLPLLPGLLHPFLPLKGPSLSTVTPTRSYSRPTHIQAVTQLCQLSLPCIFLSLPRTPPPPQTTSPQPSLYYEAAPTLALASFLSPVLPSSLIHGRLCLSPSVAPGGSGLKI